MIISQYTYFRCFDEIRWLLRRDTWILWDKSLLSKWTRMYLCLHHWKYVICISVFYLYLHYIYLNFKRGKSLKWLMKIKRRCICRHFPLKYAQSVLGSCFKVGVAKVRCDLPWISEWSGSETGSFPKSQKNGWTREKQSAEGKNKFCTSPLQKSQQPLLLHPGSC